MSGKFVNHWGKWVNSEEAVTGVLSIHSIAWEFIDDEICLTCEEIIHNIEAETLSDEDREAEIEFLECDSSHDKIIGDWLKDEEGKYYPNPDGEFAAIIREFTVQVVYSKVTTRGALCSPCYPGQVDLDTNGEFLAYTLPSELLWKE